MYDYATALDIASFQDVSTGQQLQVLILSTTADAASTQMTPHGDINAQHLAVYIWIRINVTSG